MKKYIFLIFVFIFSFESFSQKKRKDSLSQKEKKMELAFKSKDQSGFIRAVSSVLAEDEEHLKALNYLGMYHLRRRRTGLARIIFEKALFKHSKSPALHNNLGLVALKEGQKQEAVLAFERSLDYDSYYLPALVNLSSLYIEFYGYKKALPLLGRAYANIKNKKNVKLSSNYAKIANNYAVALTWSQNFKKARSIYHALYKKEQATVETLINYAILLKDHLKNLKGAMKILNQADFLVKKSRDKRQIRDLKNQIRRAMNGRK